MASKVYIGTFHSVDNILYKITELEAQGYDKGQIYAVSNVHDDLKVLADASDIAILGIQDGSLWDHTRRLFSTKDEMLTLFIKMGFDKPQAKAFYNELKESGIALFVDEMTDEERGDSADPHDSASRRAASGENTQNQANEEAVNPIANSPRINTDNL